jgi:PAS domain-containing protein
LSDIEPSKIHGDPPSAASAQGMADRKELSSLAFERTRMPIVITDARQGDLPIVLANESFLKLTGYSGEEAPQRRPAASVSMLARWGERAAPLHRVSALGLF